MSCKVEFRWDDEASVWIATSRDVPGLVLESGSFDALVERVRYAIPELLELNKKKEQDVTLIDVTFISERHDQVAVYG